MARRVAIIQYDKDGGVLQAVTSLVSAECVADAIDLGTRIAERMWLPDANSADVICHGTVRPALTIRERGKA
jgi:hypothetical protein